MNSEEPRRTHTGEAIEELTKEIAKFNQTFLRLHECIADALLHYKGK